MLVDASGNEVAPAAEGEITGNMKFKCYFTDISTTAIITYKIVDENEPHGFLTLDESTTQDYIITQNVPVDAPQSAVKGAKATPVTIDDGTYQWVFYFRYWTVEIGGKSEIVSYDKHFQAQKSGALWTSATYVAHFATPIATYTSETSTMDFYFDEDYHECTYMYPVINTHYSDNPDERAFASWQSESDGTPKVYPRTVTFHPSFKDFPELYGMAYWFWSPWYSDQSSDITGGDI